MMAADTNEEGRRARKKREVRARILQVAKRRIAARGFDAAKIDDIARGADVSQATFFNYFPTKRALLRALVDDTLHMLHAYLEGKREGARDAASVFDEYFRVSAAAVLEGRDIPRELLLEIVRTATPVGGGDAEMTRIHATFEAILRDGQARGDVRVDLAARFLAEMVFGAFAAVFTNWLNDPRYPIARRAREAARFVGEALRPRGGAAGNERAGKKSAAKKSAAKKSAAKKNGPNDTARRARGT